jgi:hypothetical protein
MPRQFAGDTAAVHQVFQLAKEHDACLAYVGQTPELVDRGAKRLDLEAIVVVV